ncbi:hypothetical protein OG21DRAFT_1414420, partial [Imleria badia]
FQEWTNLEATIELWSKDGEKWLATQTNHCKPLDPNWHQLVVILRMLQCAFDGQPIMMMDGISIGKTLQAIRFIACLAYYRLYFTTHSHFPGHFSLVISVSKAGNIPNFPVIIICLINLQDQKNNVMHPLYVNQTVFRYKYSLCVINEAH